MKALATNAKVGCAKVVIIEKAEGIIDANTVLANVIGAIKIIVAIHRGVQTIAISAAIKSARIAIINNAIRVIMAIAKGVAKVIGA